MLALALLFADVGAKFFVLSDIHFDIMYREDYNSTYQCHDRDTSKHQMLRYPTNDIQPVVRPKCDSSQRLVETSIEQMKKIDLSPDFILILGDFICHFTNTILTKENTQDFNYTKQLVYESYEIIFESLKKNFPNTQIIPSLGNNDAFKNYHLPEGQDKKEFLQFLFDLWNPFVGGIDPVFYKNGYYNTTTKTGQHVLSLNTVLFSTMVTDLDAGQREELDWIEDQLKNNENIFIVMHVPPGFSLYNGGHQQWHDVYAEDFFYLVSKYKAKISAIFAGHYHNGGFQLMDSVNLYLNPSISPIFGGNPRIRLFDWPGRDFTDYLIDSYSYTGIWYNRSLAEEFSSVNLIDLYDMIESGVITIRKYTEWITGWWVYYNPDFKAMCNSIYGNTCSSSESNLRLITGCQMKYYFSTQYNKCLKQQLIKLPRIV